MFIRDNAQKNELSKERVLMVHNFYQIGGGEHTVFENEKRLLKEHGHQLFTYTRDNAEIGDSLIKKAVLPLTTIFSFKTYREIIKIIESKKIDIVHCHNTFPLISPAVYYAARKCNVPVVQTIHNFRFLCPNGVMFRTGAVCDECLKKNLFCALKHGCYRNSRLQTIVVMAMLLVHRAIGTYKKINYIFLTDFNKKIFLKKIKVDEDRLFVKPNFEFIDGIEQIIQRNGSFVFVGRLEENKGILFLLENWNTDDDLYIFGDGTLKSVVQLQSKENKNIHYMGFMPQDEIFSYLRKATALIFPSMWYEGFPMTIIEAMALGTPVVCAEIGNQGDIIKSTKGGCVYKLDDSNSFKRAIGSVKDNFEQLSRNAKNAYEKHYTPEANYKQLKAIYEALKND